VQQSYSHPHQRKERKKNGGTITGTLRNNSFHKYARYEYKGDKTFKIKAPQCGRFWYLSTKTKNKQTCNKSISSIKKVITLALWTYTLNLVYWKLGLYAACLEYTSLAVTSLYGGGCWPKKKKKIFTLHVNIVKPLFYVYAFCFSVILRTFSKILTKFTYEQCSILMDFMFLQIHVFPELQCPTPDYANLPNFTS